MKLRVLAALFAFACLSPAFAQRSNQTVQGAPVSGIVVNRSTLNSSVTITAGNTFQTVLPSILGTQTQRQSLTIQNNNTSTDNCWVFFGALANATKAASILLAPAQALTRYWPYVPSDAVQVTCASTSDTVYVDNN